MCRDYTCANYHDLAEILQYGNKCKSRTIDDFLAEKIVRLVSLDNTQTLSAQDTHKMAFTRSMLLSLNEKTGDVLQFPADVTKIIINYLPTVYVRDELLAQCISRRDLEEFLCQYGPYDFEGLCSMIEEEDGSSHCLGKSCMSNVKAGSH